MRDLHRSVSSYHSSQYSKAHLLTRNTSVPSDIYRQELYDEDAEPGVPQYPVSAPLPYHVMECIEDAAASFSNVYTTIIESPETIWPEYSPEDLHPRPSDAKILLPDIAGLPTNNSPNALPLVEDILKKIQQGSPHLQPQHLSAALKAVKNAMILLHLQEQHDINVDTIITQPREIITAAMIVNRYLNNLSQPTTSEARSL